MTRPTGGFAHETMPAASGHSETMHRGPDGEIVETAREARQGYRDRPVLAVVAISTTLALAALLILWWVAT